MNTTRVERFLQAMLFCAALAGGASHAQTVPPPGVEAARPPTERTLQPVDRKQTRDRVRTSRDCRQEVTEIKDQYRIQQKSVQTQYETKLAAADATARDGLVKERDAKLAQLLHDGDAAAKKLGDICRADNAAILRPSSVPTDRPSPP